MDTQRPSALERTAQRFTRELKAIDDAAVRKMLSAYEPGRKRIFAQLVQLMDEIERTGIVSATEAFKLERWVTLIQQIDTEMERLLPGQTRAVTEAQRRAITLAQKHVPALFDASANAARAGAVQVRWHRVPTSAMERMVGRLQDGELIDKWLGDVGEAMEKKVAEELTAGLAEGVHPSVISARLKAQIDVSARKLDTFTRDQVLDSYRSASLAQYAANDDILDGWAWSSAHDERVCAACLGLDGRRFPLTLGYFPAHSRCRCTPIPLVKGFELPERQTGEGWLKAQGNAHQDRLLGSEGGEAFRAGEVALRDFAELERDPRWGDRYVKGSLANARKRADARREEAAA